MENQKADTLTLDRTLVVNMVEYILSRPYKEVYKLVDDMWAKGLLTRSEVEDTNKEQSSNQERPTQEQSQELKSEPQPAA